MFYNPIKQLSSLSLNPINYHKSSFLAVFYFNHSTKLIVLYFPNIIVFEKYVLAAASPVS